MKDGTFDIEQAVTLKPDVIIMNIDAKSATEESGYIEKLAKVGIPSFTSISAKRPWKIPTRRCG